MIGAAISILTTAISNISNGIPFWHGIGKAAVMGAVSGAISFGIGEITQGLTVITKAAMQAGLHGMKGGIMSAIEGGDFGSGFLAGAVSSLVSSGVEALGTDFGATATAGKQVMNNFGASSAFKAVMIASGGLSGGLSSAIAGGNFWSGVREGLITAGLNHVFHMTIGEYFQKAKFNKIQRELRNAFGDIDKAANVNNKEDLINFIKRVPTLKKFYDKFVKKWGGKINFEMNDSYQGRNLSDAITDVQDNSLQVNIYRAALSSISYLGETILHEFGHVNSAYHGFIYKNRKNYGDSKTTTALDEIYAHKFAYHHGGVSYDTAYYKSFVDFLSKRPAGKIIANDLKLPSYD